MPYDLTRQPWIAVTVEGKRVEVSLRVALKESHEIDGLAIDNPLEAVAVFRQVILPVVLHALGVPRDKYEWAGRFREGKFDSAALDAYLDEHEDKFDLLHPTWPFAQAGGWQLRVVGRNRSR